MKKQEIREELLQKRKELNSTDYEKLNEDLSINLRKFLQDKGLNLKIGSFFPMANKKEVNTIVFHNWMRAEPFNHQIYLPKTGNDCSMDFFLFEENSPLIKSALGVSELDTEGLEPLNPKDLDIILVPLIAIDIQGNRVGYGKGYYDRYLARLGKNTTIIGLSLDLPVEVLEDINEFDFKIPQAVSPHGIHFF